MIKKLVGSYQKKLKCFSRNKLSLTNIIKAYTFVQKTIPFTSNLILYYNQFKFKMGISYDTHPVAFYLYGKALEKAQKEIAKREAAAARAAARAAKKRSGKRH